MSAKAQLRKLRYSDAPWGFFTEISALTMSFLTFAIVAPRLGDVQFGLLATILATVSLLGPLLTASPEHVAVARIAQGVSVDEIWKRTLSVLFLVGPVAVGLMVVVSLVIAPETSIQAVALISAGEVLFLALSRVAIRAHESVGANAKGTRVAVQTLLSRVAALVPFALLDDPSLDAWSTLHFGSSIIAAVTAHFTLGVSRESLSSMTLPTKEDYFLGVPFALNSGPDGLLSNNDKMVMTGFGLASDTGIYAAAYRVASIANVPAKSLLRTRYSSYFRPENQSAEASKANGLAVLRATAPAGLVSAVGIFLVAPFATIILGDDFAESVTALRYLAFLPLVRSLSTPLANVLTGTGRQRLRIYGTLGAGVLNLCLNLAFIPTYGWRAAAATTLVAEIAMLAWIWWHVFKGPLASPADDKVEAGH